MVSDACEHQNLKMHAQGANHRTQRYDTTGSSDNSELTGKDTAKREHVRRGIACQFPQTEYYVSR